MPLTEFDLRMGMRLRFKDAVDVFNLESFPRHAAGTVIEIDLLADADDHVAVLLMDDQFTGLKLWRNRLHVFRPTADREITLDDFEEEVGFG